MDQQQYQDRLLAGVSRTFALTIPQLPAGLRVPVGNAYLLCRIADTIEDVPHLAPQRKEYFHAAFVDAVAGDFPAERFAQGLLPELAGQATPDEIGVIEHTPAILAITHGLNPRQRAAMERCIRIMSRGMADFERNASRRGLRDLSEMERYCYHVAGVVGEMLTELFCDYSPAIDRHRDQLQGLAVAFGQGLQMTNILKDAWDDWERGISWLPAQMFERAGLELETLQPGMHDPRFRRVLQALVGIAGEQLQHALDYTLLIPRQETGIRRFCLWAIGLALLTLRNIQHRPDYAGGADVKVSRRHLKATILITNATLRSNLILRLLFHQLSRELSPTAQPPLPHSPVGS